MPEHRLSLDPQNPGQFFACCGLFELSELIANGAEAHFEDNGETFILKTDAPVPPQDLSLEPQSETYEPTLEPLGLKVGAGGLTLSWWLNETFRKKGPLKTYGGPQTPRGVFEELLRLLDFATPFESLLRVSAYTTSRFGVDARSAWDAIDVGYSPNDERRKTDKQSRTFPWVEVLAVVGLQGFRPLEKSRSHYRYTAWLTPLTLVPARAACAVPWPGLPSRDFRFEIASRGQGYKTFLFAQGVDHV